MELRFKKKLYTILRILTGLVFIVSAITKLVSIDAFEIYIYSFGILNLNFSFLLARFIISLELWIAALLIAGIYLRPLIIFSVGLLTVFTVFIIFLLFDKNSEHCHCFGEVIKLSNISSIVKNIFLISFLLFIYPAKVIKLKFQKLILIVTLIISLSLPFITSPPDSFSYKTYAGKVSYDEFLLNKFIAENKQYTKGKQVLCFYGSNCRFCKLATKKISVIANKTNKAGSIHCVFWGTKESTLNFFKETNSFVFQYSLLPTDVFLKITNGEMPLIILVENGAIKGKYGYRSINENEIINFLK